MSIRMAAVVGLTCLAICRAASMNVDPLNLPFNALVSVSYITPGGNGGACAIGYVTSPLCPGAFTTEQPLYYGSIRVMATAPDGTFGLASLSEQPNYAAQAFVFAGLQSGTDTSVNAQANLTYFVEWIGPRIDAYLPTDLDGSFDFGTTGAFGYGAASMAITESDNQQLLGVWDAPTPISQIVSGLVYLEPDVVYQISLVANLTLNSSIDCCSQYPGDASITIDPTIAIDPSFANASAYTLGISAGLTGNSDIPEPSTLASSLAALCAVALFRRFRKN